MIALNKCNKIQMLVNAQYVDKQIGMNKYINNKIIND